MSIAATIARAVKPKAPALDSAYALPVSLKAAIASLHGALDAREQIDGAIISAAAKAVAGAEALASATATLAEIEVRLAVEVDHDKASKIEIEAIAARAAQAETEARNGQNARITKILHDSATEKDRGIADARALLETEVTLHRGAVETALQTDIAIAAQALIPVLARAHALRDAGMLHWGAPIFTDLTVPSALNGHPAPIAGTRVTTPDGGIADLMETWREHSDAVALSNSLAGLRQVRQRAAGHTDFQLRAFAPSKLSEASHQNRLAAEHNRQIEEREAARIAAEPKREGWSGRSWKVDLGPTAPMPTVG